MRRSGAVIALLSTGLLVLAAVTPVAAALGDASSAGVTWRAASPGWTNLEGTSSFQVTDGKPGQNSSKNDFGSYTLTRTDGASLKLDVKCVRVDASGWAEFAGIVTERSGVYVLGEVFLVSVKDGVPDEIGMASHGTAPNTTSDGTVRTALQRGCAAALDGKQYKRQGVILTGDIAVG